LTTYTSTLQYPNGTYHTSHRCHNSTCTGWNNLHTVIEPEVTNRKRENCTWTLYKNRDTQEELIVYSCDIFHCDHLPCVVPHNKQYANIKMYLVDNDSDEWTIAVTRPYKVTSIDTIQRGEHDVLICIDDNWIITHRLILQSFSDLPK
jgi:hypothetical protein